VPSCLVIVASKPTPTARALADALSRIEALGRHAPHLLCKNAVRQAITLGTGSREVRARYRFRCEELEGASLSAAIVAVERAYLRERAARRRARLFGRPSPRLTILILRELRLLLRLMRWRKMHAAFPSIVEAITAPAWRAGPVAAEAAE
jgi:hypothetical protein